ncbi:L-serine ammonia-lyase, iron-sulfur-dependent, subunit alpha [uncultured Sphaerochaeta sp.]|uniref:L-cysteine desulfidase family protein n=1 Tax=uncultured Sphaerochaeta sp. TaxID=886478 RepID=UPI002A0A9654|nr:L-serine ammonia-lyase, iron-sulfur-dependent, subunit alpha [uncultured Sphaerochaeta sp.]
MNMNKETYEAYVLLLNTELQPALGCTEPIAIAYAAAKAREVLGSFPEKMSVACSGNIVKNVQGVVVPNSGGLRGIDVAAILGVVGGDGSKGLEVLAKITEEDVETTRKLLLQGYCTCLLSANEDNLFIRVFVRTATDSAAVEITGHHTNITLIEKNDEILFSKEYEEAGNLIDAYSRFLNIADIVTFAETVDLLEIQEVLEREIAYNSAISKEGLTGAWGIGVGHSLLKYYDKNDVRNRACAAAAAGSDARMGGCSLPVVINSGSGNQGMTVSLPVIEYAQSLQVSHELLLRSLALSNLISMQEKSQLGSLSAFCGAVCAGAAAGCGIAFLHGGREREISNVITNCLADIGGVVCDGAKPSCASKIATAVKSGIFAFEMGMKENKCFQDGDGLVKKNGDQTIKSFTRMGKIGMKGTDEEILNIMLEK